MGGEGHAECSWSRDYAKVRANPKTAKASLRSVHGADIGWCPGDEGGNGNGVGRHGVGQGDPVIERCMYEGAEAHSVGMQVVNEDVL